MKQRKRRESNFHFNKKKEHARMIAHLHRSQHPYSAQLKNEIEVKPPYPRSSPPTKEPFNLPPPLPLQPTMVYLPI